MRRRIFNIISVLLLLAAAATISYPYWSRWYAGQMQATIMQDFESDVQELTPQMKADLFQAALAYNERLARGELADEQGLQFQDPFTFGSDSRPAGYQDVLATPGTHGVMAIISIPTLGLRLPIYHGVEEHILRIGVGHVPQTALPVGGEGTHAVLAGHRGLPGNLLFTDLNKLKTGDVLHIEVLDRTIAYEVHDVSTVLPEDVSSLAPKPGEDLLTLATCTPLGVNSHRLLVTGHRVPYVPAPGVWPDANTMQLLIALGIALVVLLVLLYWRWQSRRRLRRELMLSAPQPPFPQSQSQLPQSQLPQ